MLPFPQPRPRVLGALQATHTLSSSPIWVPDGASGRGKAMTVRSSLAPGGSVDRQQRRVMGDEAGEAAEALNARLGPSRGAGYGQWRWAGLELDTDYEFPKITPRIRPGFLANMPSMWPPEPSDGERLCSTPQHGHGTASLTVNPPGLGKPGHLENQCRGLEAQSSRAGRC